MLRRSVVHPSVFTFDVVATLRVRGGARTTVEAGRTISDPISVADGGSLSVSIERVELRNFVYAHGIQLGIGLA